MKNVLLLFMIMLFALSAQSQEKIIFDTDINGDVDDVGALAMLNALCDNGEAELLACMSSNPGKYVSECIDVINTYYHRPDVPIGALRGSAGDGYYTRALAENYPHDAVRENLPEPADLYREILADQDDSSVTIVTVGYLPNLAALLRSGPDDVSPLSGPELVQKKVKLWVCMGGVFPSGSEHNLTFLYPEDAQYAIENWPGRIIFTGWEVGKEVITGFEVQKYLKNSPVTEGYKLYYCSWAFDGNPYYAYYNGHYSWDQTAVLIATRGYEDYWDIVEEGYNKVAADGTNEWVTTENRDHAYVVPKMPHDEVAAIIDELMNQPPIGAHFYASSNFGWLPFNVELDATLSNVGVEHEITEYKWQIGDAMEYGGQISYEFTEPGAFAVELAVSDDKGNVYQASDSIFVSHPVFSPIEPFGTAHAYERINESLWSTREDQGDLRYFLSNRERAKDSTFDGVSFIKDSLYTDFTFEFSVRSAEDFEENRSPEYSIYWGAVDEENFSTIQMRTRIAYVSNYTDGERTNVIRTKDPGLTDDDYHRVTVTRTGDSLAILIDNQPYLVVRDALLGRMGKLGFGSNDDAVFFDDIEVSRVPTAVDTKGGSVPVRFQLSQNYPNPFNPTTHIAFELPKAGQVKLDVYNIHGQRIETLVNEMKKAGQHVVEWNASEFPSGLYYYSLTTEFEKATRRMILLR